MINGWNRLQKKRKNKNTKRLYEEKESTFTAEEEEFSQLLDDNLTRIKKDLGNSGDLMIREFKMGRPLNHRIASVYINGLADKLIMNSSIIERIMEETKELKEGEWWPPNQLVQYLREHILANSQVVEVSDWKKMLLQLLAGNTILFVDGWNQALVCSAQGGELRSISEPLAEPSVRGPKESFTEALITNTSMIRRRIKSPNLWLETMNLGKITQTQIGIMYMNGIVNEKLLTEVKERLGKMDVDEIIGSNTVEEWISDELATPWPTIFTTERPDVVTGNLLEGRVAIFVDGTPTPLILPATWNQFFQTAEDYYLRWNMAGFLRVLRIVSFLITLLGPSLFVAFVSFHPELIPTPLLINIAAQREAVPFPILIEALLMEFTFEVLREAGTRMPRPVGQAVSIVGALVLGDAAVSAGIVSSAMVIVVAATAIASFTIPHYAISDAVRMLRFIMMILAGTFGLYGIGLGVIILVAHTCSLRSFGIPYLAPFAPIILDDQKDAIVRFPLPYLAKRPRLISQKKMLRSGDVQNRGPSPGNQDSKDNESKRDSSEP